MTQKKNSFGNPNNTALTNNYLQQLGLAQSENEELTNKKAEQEAEALVSKYEKNGIKTI